jgi:hypothetical protein
MSMLLSTLTIVAKASATLHRQTIVIVNVVTIVNRKPEHGALELYRIVEKFRMIIRSLISFRYKGY